MSNLGKIQHIKLKGCFSLNVFIAVVVLWESVCAERHRICYEGHAGIDGAVSIFAICFHFRPFCFGGGYIDVVFFGGPVSHIYFSFFSSFFFWRGGLSYAWASAPSHTFLRRRSCLSYASPRRTTETWWLWWRIALLHEKQEKEGSLTKWVTPRTSQNSMQRFQHPARQRNSATPPFVSAGWVAVCWHGHVFFGHHWIKRLQKNVKLCVLLVFMSIMWRQGNRRGAFAQPFTRSKGKQTWTSPGFAFPLRFGTLCCLFLYCLGQLFYVIISCVFLSFLYI